MKRLTLIIITIFTLFGCADDNNLIQPVPYIPDNDTNINNNDNNTITDNNTGTDIIDNKPVADFNYTVNGNIVSFTDNSTDDYGIIKWEWNFGKALIDGEIISNEKNPVYEFKNPIRDDISDGTYNVKLTVYDNISQFNTIEKQIKVTGLRANFSYTINKNTVTFRDRSLNEGSNCFLVECKQAVKWEWNFGDNNISNEQNPIHTYQSSGTYDVMLKVFTIDNISHYTVQNITIE